MTARDNKAVLESSEQQAPDSMEPSDSPLFTLCTGHIKFKFIETGCLNKFSPEGGILETRQ